MNVVRGYFSRKRNRNKVFFSIFLVTVCICVLAGFVGFLVTFITEGDQLHYSTRWGYMPISAYLITLTPLILLAIIFGIKTLLARRKNSNKMLKGTSLERRPKA